MKKLDDELDAANVSGDGYAAGKKAVGGEFTESEMKKLDEELDAAEVRDEIPFLFFYKRSKKK